LVSTSAQGAWLAICTCVACRRWAAGCREGAAGDTAAAPPPDGQKKIGCPPAPARGWDAAG